ncbi:MAG: riboflavin kinase, partial [Weeksellaceae bacterium]
MHHILKLPFTIHGTVIKHLGRGRDLGYPTANFPVTPETPEGIFVGYTKLDNRNLPALIFIGA